MSNYITTTCTITGPADDIERFKRAHIVGETDEQRTLDFGTIGARGFSGSLKTGQARCSIRHRAICPRGETACPPEPIFTKLADVDSQRRPCRFSDNPKTLPPQGRAPHDGEPRLN